MISAVHEMHNDLASVAIENANMSCRSSTRRAHNVITWTSKLMALQGETGVMGGQKQFSTAATSKRVDGHK